MLLNCSFVYIPQIYAKIRRARDRPRPRALHNPSRQIGFFRACRRSRTALQACQTPRPIASRPFIIADYRHDAAGMLVAVRPDVGTAESTPLFLRGLYESIQHYGLASIYYQDHGTGFTSKDTQTVVAQLPAALVHGEVGYPEGRGKIEKFNQTALHAVLKGLDGRPDSGSDAKVDTCNSTCPAGACVNLCGQPCGAACTDYNGRTRSAEETIRSSIKSSTI